MAAHVCGLLPLLESVQLAHCIGSATRYCQQNGCYRVDKLYKDERFVNHLTSDAAIARMLRDLLSDKPQLSTWADNDPASASASVAYGVPAGSVIAWAAFSAAQLRCAAASSAAWQPTVPAVTQQPQVGLPSRKRS